jgi:hypothetical protein
VHAELHRRDAEARHSADAARAEELAAAGDLGRLSEQLAATEAKLDRAKQVGVGAGALWGGALEMSTA